MVEKNMQKSKIKVVDNFLPIFEFNPIKSQMESIDFPWYWQEHSHGNIIEGKFIGDNVCLLYTSPSPRDYGTSRMPSSA